LPDDISVYEVLPVHPNAHARYDAIKRSYEYHLHLDPHPFLSIFSSLHTKSLIAIEKMEIGLASLLKIDDFRYLCLAPDRSKNTLCKIYEASLEVSTDQKRFVFNFTANRFLKSMIRIIVGRLLLVGEGKISLKEFDDLNTGKMKLPYPVIAFPQGLHLTKIEYPYLTRQVKRM
jgi:tRNA pseudouridine38-40 synthase